MRHPDLLDRNQTAVAIIDVQERLVGVLPVGDWLPNIARIARAATLLGLPVALTEQYRKGLGPTVPAVEEALGEAARFEKLAFSACGEGGFLELLQRWEKRQILLCGIEAHVCVQQTALDLLQHGLQVHLPADAVASRSPANRRAGLAKMRRARAVITSTEMALFELLETAAAAEFKEVQALIK